ncbi:MAG: phytanoyl-CoA dioxygenase family protein [Pirellulaceae bacterium]
MSNSPCKQVSPRDVYFFDLQGFLILRQALSKLELRELHTCLDAIPPLQAGERHGDVHAHDYQDGGQSGLNLQQIYEAGEPFEKLIDHPAWFEHMKLFVGGEGTFDHHHGPLFIDENFVSLRKPGEAIGMHSGGFPSTHRSQYRFHGDRFLCGQVNALIAFTNIGPGDGGTTLIPGSHKSNFEHPDLKRVGMRREGFGELIEGALELEMEAGDALVFVDSLCHGSARRLNPGIRKIAVYRYGPSWGNFRHGFRPSQELLQRLTPQRRSIVSPAL